MDWILVAAFAAHWLLIWRLAHKAAAYREQAERYCAAFHFEHAARMHQAGKLLAELYVAQLELDRLRQRRVGESVN